MDQNIELPPASSPSLHIDHPTEEECLGIWTMTSDSWRDSLPLPLYIAESKFLTTIPLARDGGMTTWILVEKSFPPNKRPILCSCESFRKKCIISDPQGNSEDIIVHAIASVYCTPEYRGRGYASKHMVEMSKTLREWQSEHGQPVASILYSDIGKEFYARFGWIPNDRNTHLVFPPSSEVAKSFLVRPIHEEDLQTLCQKDEEMIRATMAEPDEIIKLRFTILPNLDHMLWHIRKEDFACEYIFGNVPQVKGAISGRLGKQVWAIWTHRYYSHPADGAGDNVLYILRLVVEGDKTANKLSPYAREAMHMIEEDAEYAEPLMAVLQAAQKEAVEWRLDHVKLWEPSPFVRALIAKNGLDCEEVN